MYLFPHLDTRILIIEVFQFQSCLQIYQDFLCYHTYLNANGMYLSNVIPKCSHGLSFVLFYVVLI